MSQIIRFDTPPLSYADNSDTPASVTAQWNAKGWTAAFYVTDVISWLLDWERDVMLGDRERGMLHSWRAQLPGKGLTDRDIDYLKRTVLRIVACYAELPSPPPSVASR